MTPLPKASNPAFSNPITILCDSIKEYAVSDTAIRNPGQIFIIDLMEQL